MCVFVLVIWLFHYPTWCWVRSRCSNIFIELHQHHHDDRDVRERALNAVVVVAAVAAAQDDLRAFVLTAVRPL